MKKIENIFQLVGNYNLKYMVIIMEANTILLISSIIFQLFAEIRRSRCSDISIGDCITIHRDVIDED